MTNGSFGRCKPARELSAINVSVGESVCVYLCSKSLPKDIGTNDTSAAKIQIEAIVIITTILVTQRVYLTLHKWKEGKIE